ncbi:MAG TPA: hypothetical protein DCG75_03560 [Bacteroidales bacterium]|nr:hypothetical protein [Bacteroidales bacterium]
MSKGTLIRPLEKVSFGDEIVKGISKEWINQLFRTMFPNKQIRIIPWFGKYYEEIASGYTDKYYFAGFFTGSEEYALSAFLKTRSTAIGSFGVELNNVPFNVNQFMIFSEATGSDAHPIGDYIFYGWRIEIVN